MKIEHVAIWVKDLERAKDFYIKYFNTLANDKYMRGRGVFFGISNFTGN